MTYRTFYAYNFDKNNTYSEEIMINEPRKCMHCNETGLQNFIVGMVTRGKYDNFHNIGLYTCPLCASTTIHFLSKWDESDMDLLEPTYRTFETIPAKRKKIEAISDDLHTKFPDFFNIYSQSEIAEKENLDQIAGMGYRKALEFLVTDYLLEYPVSDATEDWLKDPRTSLNNKISKIKNDRMQTLAKAASFLGNDETHYTRRHPEHDIDSMKAFIRFLLSEIQYEIEYKRAKTLINKPRL
ncbi:hypothetical protein [Oceanobacillus sp. FSL H7-0719]|uniref:hypothetical protein n=1 Tax=Oceanobacillus sp. FSL H7-0719 TaxID=2954507 RepID=UPI003254095F